MKQPTEPGSSRGKVRRWHWWPQWGWRHSSEQRQALALPPMSRGMQLFAALAFLLLGMTLTLFTIWNPLRLPFLPAPPTPGTNAVAAREGGSEASPAALYRCSMHPDVMQNEPGQCPFCDMALMPVGEESVTVSADPGAGEDHGEILYWYAPMDPTYIRDEPGVSPMGMSLVPRYADEASADASGIIEIDPVQVQNTGVVSVPASRGEMARTIRTVGILDFDAELITWINTKFSGWIERVHITYVGQEVRRGEPLFEIYSPELVTTQEEYIRALEYAASLEQSDRREARRQAESLLRSTRDRLAYWDISKAQIEELDRSRRVQRRLTVLSPVDGVVVELMNEALEGMFVQTGMNLYKIAGLSSIWVHADVYESDLPWIEAGQHAEISFRHEPESVFRGEVLFLYPEVSAETRTLKICVEVPNGEGRLRPGMYADVVVHGPGIKGAVLIPDSAVLRSGERDLVFVDLGSGRFEPREITLGVRGERDQVQVLKGIVPGEAVVTQAQFMLDSESRVQEAIAKFMARGSHRDAAAAPTDDGRGERR